MVAVEIVDGQRTRELRRSVLRPHLPPGAVLPGDDVADAIHVAALDDDGTVVCTCLIYAAACPWLPGRPAWHLRQMATSPARQGEGHGRAVIATALALVAGAGAQVLWCYARESATGFYARLGFATHGEVFTDEEHPLPHVRMWREPGGAADSSG